MLLIPLHSHIPPHIHMAHFTAQLQHWVPQLLTNGLNTNLSRESMSIMSQRLELSIALLKEQQRITWRSSMWLTMKPNLATREGPNTFQLKELKNMSTTTQDSILMFLALHLTATIDHLFWLHPHWEAQHTTHQHHIPTLTALMDITDHHTPTGMLIEPIIR